MNIRVNDFRCRRALRLTWEMIEIENLMSWLSTLGGAFSALGDSFENCVSIKQQEVNGIRFVPL